MRQDQDMPRILLQALQLWFYYETHLQYITQVSYRMREITDFDLIWLIQLKYQLTGTFSTHFIDQDEEEIEEEEEEEEEEKDF